MAPRCGGGTIPVAPEVVTGGLTTPSWDVPPGTSAWSEGNGVGTAVCGPLASGFGAGRTGCATLQSATANDASPTSVQHKQHNGRVRRMFVSPLQFEVCPRR